MTEADDEVTAADDIFFAAERTRATAGRTPAELAAEAQGRLEQWREIRFDAGSRNEQAARAFLYYHGRPE